jgi:hypothetical protein
VFEKKNRGVTKRPQVSLKLDRENCKHRRLVSVKQERYIPLDGNSGSIGEPQKAYLPEKRSSGRKGDLNLPIDITRLRATGSSQGLIKLELPKLPERIHLEGNPQATPEYKPESESESVAPDQETLIKRHLEKRKAKENYEEKIDKLFEGHKKHIKTIKDYYTKHRIIKFKARDVHEIERRFGLTIEDMSNIKSIHSKLGLDDQKKNILSIRDDLKYFEDIPEKDFTARKNSIDNNLQNYEYFVDGLQLLVTFLDHES